MFKSITPRCFQAKTLSLAGILLLASLCFCKSHEDKTVQLEHQPQLRLELPEVFELEAPMDNSPPEFEGLSSVNSVGWGRLHMKWSEARDDYSEPGAIRYRLSGTRPPSMRPPFSELSHGNLNSISFDIEPGQLEATITAPLDTTWWSATAIDEAGNESAPRQPLETRTRPPLLDIVTGLFQAPLLECSNTPQGHLLCAGRNGRLAKWDGRHWWDSTLGFSEIRLVKDLRGSIRLLTSLEQLEWNDQDDIRPISVHFEQDPVLPARRMSFEPSGLALLLDLEGAVWASEDNSYYRMHNPLLLTSEEYCPALVDLVFQGNRGFARCIDDRQYLLRADGSSYSWMELPDSHGLEAEPLPQPGIIFGEGRQISLMTSDGQLWRYDMGGWRLFPPSQADDSLEPVTAMAFDQESQDLLFAHGCHISRMDSLGSIEQVTHLPCQGAIIHIETSNDINDYWAVSEQAEVFRWTTGETIYSAPKPMFSKVVRQQADPAGVFYSTPEAGLYQLTQGYGSFSPLPLIADDLVIHEVALRADNSAIMVGDGGTSGGRIMVQRGENMVQASFLYPLPREQTSGDNLESEQSFFNTPVQSPGSTRVPGEAQDLSLLLPSVSASMLDEPPLTPPPVRAVATSDQLSTTVAVGDDGSSWIEIDSHWRWIDTGSNAHLTSVTIVDRHAFVAGGAEGLLIECQLDQCIHEILPIGDLKGFFRGSTGILAFGSRGLAERAQDGSWSLISLNFEGPYPSGSAPEEILAIDETNDLRWLLGSEGSLWLQRDDRLIAMALVQDPLDLWVLEEGWAAVVTPHQILQVQPPSQ